MARNLKPVSPGEILLMEFLKPLGISQSNERVRLCGGQADRLRGLLEHRLANSCRGQ